jgi:hypothetical protein
MEALTNMISSKSRRPSAKAVQTLLVQLPDIHPTKVPFAEDKLPDGIILSPVAIAPCLNMSRPSAKTSIPLALAYPHLQFTRHCLPLPKMRFVRRNDLSLKRDDVLRLRRIPPFVSFCFVGWLFILASQRMRLLRPRLLSIAEEIGTCTVLWMELMCILWWNKCTYYLGHSKRVTEVFVNLHMN